MARKPTQMRMDEQLLEYVEDVRGGLSRTQFIEACVWQHKANQERKRSGEAVVEPQERVEPQGRTIDPYPSAPMDPAARREWTARRAAGWAPFGLPAAQANAELIAQQKRTEGK